MQSILKVYCRLLLTFVALFAITGFSFAQISGSVKDVNNEPIIGASIIVKGSTVGSISDANGNFSINTTDGKTLEISSIGYNKVEMPASSGMTVVLSDNAQQIGDVEITAEFGVKRAARSVGAAVQSVSGSDIAESGRENFVDAFNGRVSGVNVTSSSGAPGSSSTVVFRAPTSISGNNSPLFVIDGIPMSNSTFNPDGGWAKVPATAAVGAANDFTNRAGDIDPNDIESVTILKGAAAAALYGSDASNGAVIITTKKGKAGKGKVTYSNNFEFSQVYRYPEVQTVYDQGTFGTTNYFYKNKFGGEYLPDTKLYNNVKDLFETGFMQKHNLSFEMGNDAITLRAAANILDQQGVLPTTGYNRKNISLAGTAKIFKWLSINGSLQYINSTNNKVAKGSGGVLDWATQWPLTDNMKNWITPDGIKYPDNYNDIDILNPYYEIYKNKRYDATDRFISALNLAIEPIKNLVFRAQLGMDVSSSAYITSINPLWTTSATKNGSYDHTTVLQTIPTINILGSYNKTFDKFGLNLQVGYHQYENASKYTAIRGEKFYVRDLHSIQNCDPATLVNKQTTTTRRIQAVSGQLEASWNNMVFVTLRARNDWSSTLPINNRRYFYPAADVSFMVSELPFLKQNSHIWSYLKLRGSAAQVGKDAPPLSILPTLELKPTTQAGYGYGFTGPNSTLKPELNTAWEVGMEGRLFENRLNFDVAYYRTTSIDQIITGFRMSYATGFVLNNRNIGSFMTEGVEFLVSYDFIRSKDWTFTAGVNGSRNWSKVNSLPEGLTEYYNSASWLSGNIRNGITVGNSITTLSGNDYQRNKNGQILIDPTSGLPLTAATFTILGDREPKLSYGITGNLRWKQLSFSCLLNGKLGTQVVNGTDRLMMGTGTSEASARQRQNGPIVFNGVIKDGNEDSASPTISNITVDPAKINGYAGADPNWIAKNINFLNIAELRLQYRFVPTAVKKVTRNIVSDLSLFAATRDLYLFTNYSGLDPAGNGSTSAVGGNGTVGFDMLSIGAPRTYTFGVNISF